MCHLAPIPGAQVVESQDLHLSLSPWHKSRHWLGMFSGSPGIGESGPWDSASSHEVHVGCSAHAMASELTPSCASRRSLVPGKECAQVCGGTQHPQVSSIARSCSICRLKKGFDSALSCDLG